MMNARPAPQHLLVELHAVSNMILVFKRAIVATVFVVMAACVNQEGVLQQIVPANVLRGIARRPL